MINDITEKSIFIELKKIFREHDKVEKTVLELLRLHKNDTETYFRLLDKYCVAHGVA
jgi:hypothetical protein